MKLKIHFLTYFLLECKIHSKGGPPSIKWFRKQETNVNNFKTPSTSTDNEEDEYYHQHRAAIKYFENTYDLLQSSGEMGVAEDTYLSKLIIESASETDVGLYVCVGINYRGFKMREYFLSLQDSSSGTSGSKYHLFLLFLIPVIFALIPLILYCCFKLILRSNQVKELQKHSTYGDNRIRTEIKSRVSSRDAKYAVVNINII